MGDVSVDNKTVARDGWNGYDYLLCECDDDYYTNCLLSADEGMLNY